MIRVGVVGGTGYTGVELLRLLVRHPGASVQLVTSRSEVGMRVDALFPSLRGWLDLEFAPPDAQSLSRCDLVFFATPNGTSMSAVPGLLKAGVRVIDLSADFRLKDPLAFERWYGMAHLCPEILPQAIYGLPELHREVIRGAALVANPGCYPTAVTLGFLPLVEAGLVRPDRLIADAKSGVSGAGRKAEIAYLLPEAGDNLKAYGVSGHRHLPEIVQTLSGIDGAVREPLFVPHLVPMIRGIHATLYAELLRSEADLQALYSDRYQAEPFVDVMPPGAHPETRSVRGANLCRLAIHRPGSGLQIVVLSVIDNLVKGAAGQAVQNMNIMFGLEETSGLRDIALSP